MNSQYTFKDRYHLLERIGIKQPTPDMVWRVDDAIYLAKCGYVKFAPESRTAGLVKSQGKEKHFIVRSQSDPHKVYHVTFNGSPATYCSCPDWHKHDLELAEQGIPFSLWQCKHGIAARLYASEVRR